MQFSSWRFRLVLVLIIVVATTFALQTKSCSPSYGVNLYDCSPLDPTSKE